MRPPQPTFLFSVDLEDLRQLVPGGEGLSDGVVRTVPRFLEFFRARDLRVTFFTTGDVARRYPELVASVLADGHEIGCHTSDHTPLDRHDAQSFRDDLKRCLEDFASAGATDVIGFRAPVGSLVAHTAWAYDVLRELGFRYSSSVVAAPNPLYGWPEFGPVRPRIVQGVFELPMTLSEWPGLRVPIAGGIYMRVLPFAVIRYAFRKLMARERLVLGYTHPHDIDTEQERFMFPELGGSRFYNWLMYRNRDQVLPRLDRLLREGAQTMPYREYVEHALTARADA